jgi:outer membrane protein assembly complex protein YaeT
VGRHLLILIVCGLLLLACGAAQAIPVEGLDPSREWLVSSLNFNGNKRFSSGEIEEILQTKTRPWYVPWRERPRFDAEVFAADLKRIERFYQSHGYYETRITHDLQVDDERHLVSATVTIEENPPVILRSLSIEVTDHPELQAEIESLRPEFFLKPGKPFTEEDYQQTEARIKDFFYDHGRAYVKIARKAQVFPEEREANVAYSVTAGPEAVFGDTRIDGLENVTPSVVSNELSYKPGETFSGKALRQSRRNLQQLDLFSEIEVEPQTADAGATVVPVIARVREKPPREIKIGLGYGTEDKLRGQIRWRDNNFFSGARQLEIGFKASFIAREVDARFVQPHFLGQNNRFTASLGPKQFVEPAYTLNLTRFQPRLERKFSEQFSAFFGYRIEYDDITKLSHSIFAFPDPSRPKGHILNRFDRKGWLSAFGIGALWNTTDDRENPSKGWIHSLLLEQAGGPWSGSYDFYKLTGESKYFYPLAERTVLASRLKLGFADNFNGSHEVPIFERFFAGGGSSVRGFGRRRLGPLSPRNDPIGGKSLIEGSAELRRIQLYKQLGGVVFIDFGQVSLHRFDPPISDIKFAGGFGVRYPTPIGPLRLDFGFPFQRRDKDRAWQIFFDIGQSF